jgi:hypothetical protein
MTLVLPRLFTGILAPLTTISMEAVDDPVVAHASYQDSAPPFVLFVSLVDKSRSSCSLVSIRGFIKERS